jgi:hypothetical protein
MDLRDIANEDWKDREWKVGIQSVTMNIDDDDHRSLVEAVALAQRVMWHHGESTLPEGKGDLMARYLGEICRCYIDEMGQVGMDRKGP